MSATKDAVQKATDAYEAIPFQQLVRDIAAKLGPRGAMALKPKLVEANQTLRVILEILNQPDNAQKPN